MKLLKAAGLLQTWAANACVLLSLPQKAFLYMDCPEKHQDFEQMAKKFTSGMVYGKMAEIEPVTTDRYGKTVALVKVNGQSLKEALLKARLA